MECNSIKDIRTYRPINNTKAYFLDTNVLYWYTYPRFSTASNLPLNAIPYYNFVDYLVSSGNPLYTSIYNLTELLNVIEKNEFDLYKELHPGIPYTKKDYRKISEERSSLKKILKTTIGNVNSICKVLAFDFSSDNLNSFVDELPLHRCDIFDYAILKNCIASGHLNIISDDSDFATMEKINLHTANLSVIK